MLKFIKSTETSGDCTAYYDVQLDKNYTVESFIDTILKEQSKEWGSFKFPTDYYGKYQYRYGNLLQEIPPEYRDKKVIKVVAVGGWSVMDYTITYDDSPIIKVEQDYVDSCEHCVCYLCDEDIEGDSLKIKNKHNHTINICTTCHEVIKDFKIK